MNVSSFIAIDWGTTNRRIYSIDAGGSVLATTRDDRGMLAMNGVGYEDEVASIRALHGDVPVICAGMVGSARGWMEASYLPCPANLKALADALLWVDARTAIVPGLSATDGCIGDVMRGEEVQLLGSILAGMAPPDSVLCQPGTHSKWARMESGGVAAFRTGMTGEVFALLRQHSLLADFMAGPVDDCEAFREGLVAAARGTLLTDLFRARASVLLGLSDRANIAPYISGILIGSDVREQRLASGDIVHILADPQLGSLYAAALENVGATALVIPSQAGFIAGVTAIWRIIDGRA